MENTLTEFFHPPTHQMLNTDVLTVCAKRVSLTELYLAYDIALVSGA